MIGHGVEMNKWMVVSYYTLGTFYARYAERFVKSLKRYGILHHVSGVPNLKDWYKNTCYKPTFLAACLKAFPETDVVWVDCDAEFRAYPILFDTLDGDVAAHLFDRKLYQRNSKCPAEVLSGTVYLRNNAKVHGVVDEWVKECEKNPRVWDQKSLAKILHDDFYRLPPEYCMINETMNERVEKPIIVHFQASREVRKNKSLLK